MSDNVRFGITVQCDDIKAANPEEAVYRTFNGASRFTVLVEREGRVTEFEVVTEVRGLDFIREYDA